MKNKDRSQLVLIMQNYNRTAFVYEFIFDGVNIGIVDMWQYEGIYYRCICYKISRTPFFVNGLDHLKEELTHQYICTIKKQKPITMKNSIFLFILSGLALLLTGVMLYLTHGELQELKKRQNRIDRRTDSINVSNEYKSRRLQSVKDSIRFDRSNPIVDHSELK